MNKRDLIFIVSAVILCAVLFTVNRYAKNGGDTVQIYVNAKLCETVPLNENSVKEINGGTNRVRIENGEVFMEYADCPDKLCVKQGKISDSSRDIVCLPNKVTVKVIKKSETDAVSR